MLRSALDGAVRDGLLARNPAAVIRRPGVERTEARHLSPIEVRSLFSAAESSRYHRALVLIAATGMRRGECLALRWADIDHDAELLKVRGTLCRIDGKLRVTEPKTERSRRVLPLSTVTAALLTTQRKAQVAERLHAGSVWTDTGYVFTTETGQPVDPRNLYRVVQAAAKRVGPKDVGVHSLRHSAATAMLEAGVNIRPSLICWGTRRSASPVTSTGIHPMTVHTPRSPSCPTQWGSKAAAIPRCYTRCYLRAIK